MNQERLLTVGHGTLTQEALTDLLVQAEVGLLVDVRRFPGSRRHPQFASEAMEEWLPDAGVAYRWEQRLGGRRKIDPQQQDADPWWRVEAFRAYAAYTRTPEFEDGMTAVLSEVRSATTDSRTIAVMCSESVWWRCHRRLISDVALLLHDVEVVHLAHTGKLSPHPPSAGARVATDGLRYDLEDAT